MLSVVVVVAAVISIFAKWVVAVAFMVDVVHDVLVVVVVVVALIKHQTIGS